MLEHIGNEQWVIGSVMALKATRLNMKLGNRFQVWGYPPLGLEHFPQPSEESLHTFNKYLTTLEMTAEPWYSNPRYANPGILCRYPAYYLSWAVMSCHA